MKKTLYCLLLLSFNMAYGQYSFRSADGSSGIIVGTSNASKFTGINYALSTSSLGFSYRQSQQRVKNSNFLNTEDSKPSYPDVIGHSFNLGVGIKESQASLLKDKLWHGGVNASYDFSYTWDKTPIDESNDQTGSVLRPLYSSSNDTKATPDQFSSEDECVKKYGSPCISAIVSVSYLNLDAYESRKTRLNQLTFFLRLSSALGRQNLAIARPALKKDSLTLKSEFFITPIFTLGINWRKQFSAFPNVLFTGAISLASYFQSQSTSRLTAYTFQQIDTLYNAGKTAKLSDNQSYYLGKTAFEYRLNPRIDLVMSIPLGEKKTYVNIIGALSPNVSSFSDLRFRNNYAFGLGLSLPQVPDQMLFAILFEDLKTNSKEKHSNAITLYASVPFSFK